MAGQKVIKVPDDIEFRVIGSGIGLLIASAGLLGGSMVHLRSFDYWLDDIVPLALAAFMALRLVRSLIATMTIYEGGAASAACARRTGETLAAERAAMAQLAAKPVSPKK